MSAFEVVTIVVSIVAVALALTSYFRVNRVLQRLGQEGTNWFSHSEDLPHAERPREDERDDPLPRRPLRARADD